MRKSDVKGYVVLNFTSNVTERPFGKLSKTRCCCNMDISGTSAFLLQAWWLTFRILLIMRLWLIGYIHIHKRRVLSYNGCGGGKKREDMTGALIPFSWLFFISSGWPSPAAAAANDVRINVLVACSLSFFSRRLTSLTRISWSSSVSSASSMRSSC